MRARAVSWRRSRDRNGRPLRPSTTTRPAASTSAQATSSGPPCDAGLGRGPAARHEGAQPGRRRGRADRHHRARRVEVDHRRPSRTGSRTGCGGPGRRAASPPRRGRPATPPSPGHRAAGRRRPRAPARTSSTSTPSTWDTSEISRSDERLVGQLDHQLVDGPAAAALEDVDAHQVAAHGPDAAGHGTQARRADRAPTPAGCRTARRDASPACMNRLLPAAATCVGYASLDRASLHLGREGLGLRPGAAKRPLSRLAYVRHHLLPRQRHRSPPSSRR